MAFSHTGIGCGENLKALNYTLALAWNNREDAYVEYVWTIPFDFWSAEPQYPRAKLTAWKPTNGVLHVLPNWMGRPPAWANLAHNTLFVDCHAVNFALGYWGSAENIACPSTIPGPFKIGPSRNWTDQKDPLKNVSLLLELGAS